MRVAVFGTRKLGYDGLKAIIDCKRHDVVFVVTAEYEITEGYGNWEFVKLCTENDIPFFVGNKLGEKEQDKLRKARPDIGVSLYWRRLLRSPVIDIPRYGFINIHAGALPRYRGFASSVWQMLCGEKEVGLAIHKVVDGEADNGDILTTVKVSVDDKTTIRDLSDRLFSAAIVSLIPELDKIEQADEAVGWKQEESKAMYSFPRLPRDGRIDWSEPAKEIDLLIRAVTRPYFGAYTHLQDQQGDIRKLVIWRAHVLSKPPKFVGVAGHVVKNDKETGDSWVLTGDGILVLDEVQLDGEEPFQSGKVWRSVQIRLGLDIEDELMRLQRHIKGK